MKNFGPIWSSLIFTLTIVTVGEKNAVNNRAHVIDIITITRVILTKKNTKHYKQKNVKSVYFLML